jgi:hypothetical protein
MFNLQFDHHNLLLTIDIKHQNVPLANCWLLRSDGSVAQKIQLNTSFQFDCSHLFAGNWFVKLEMPGYTGLKKFTITDKITP